MVSKKYYAHTPPQKGGSWHDLPDHLGKVATLAQEFARVFSDGNLAYVAGLWHDLGKFSPAFQDYLQRCFEAEARGTNPPGRGPDHSSAGAVLSTLACLPGLDFLIAGHHGGLSSPSALKARIQEKAKQPEIMTALETALKFPELNYEPPEIKLPKLVEEGRSESWEMFLRFLFSCLVDADRLDTESHFDPAHLQLRTRWADFAALPRRFDRFYETLLQLAEPSEVNRVRLEVYEACLQAATEKPGLFRLTVPTGGGKTLASVAFALQHAKKFGLRRIVVAVPFTSITEQTAKALRGALGKDAVLEHHSAIEHDTGSSTGQMEDDVRRRLAAENWDAPVIVTTTVQLFESLFSNRPSACRKLHRLAKSVIILDEVQSVPVRLLTPILDALNELVQTYGSSIVLCTATQPAFEQLDTRLLSNTTEIVPQYRDHFKRLQRVTYNTSLPELDWHELAERVAEHQQVMVVLNTIKDAQAALEHHQQWDTPAIFHLSSNLCPEHRRYVLKEVQERLHARLPCRLISTQVVEAGVDIDFPVVYRALGPLEGIVQAAGRCNREGLLDEGQLIVFKPKGGRLPTGSYRTATAETEKLLRKGIDLHDPALFNTYYTSFYKGINPDQEDIQYLRRNLNFREVNKKFRLISEDTVAAIVRYQPEAEQIDELLWQTKNFGLNRERIRKLQPFAVSLRDYEFESAKRDGLIREVVPGLYEWRGDYDEIFGIRKTGLDPALQIWY